MTICYSLLPRGLPTKVPSSFCGDISNVCVYVVSDEDRELSSCSSRHRSSQPLGQRTSSSACCAVVVGSLLVGPLAPDLCAKGGSNRSTRHQTPQLWGSLEHASLSTSPRSRSKEKSSGSVECPTWLCPLEDVLNVCIEMVYTFLEKGFINFRKVHGSVMENNFLVFAGALHKMEGNPMEGVKIV